MRFIMTCMVIVGLCLLAMPLIPAFNGIQQEREAIMASAASGVNLAVPPPVETEIPASMMASDMDAAAVAGIEPAAGADMTATPDTLVGGFSDHAPDALAEPAPAIMEPATSDEAPE